MTILQICFAYSRNYIPVLIREIFQKFRLCPSFGTFRWQCKQKKGHSKTIKGIWKLFYHLQETIGAFAISLTISILRWFIGFLLDWSASLLAVSFHNRILCLIIYCVTSLPLFIWHYILMLDLPFEIITSVFVFKTYEQGWFIITNFLCLLIKLNTTRLLHQKNRLVKYENRALGHTVFILFCSVY